MSLFDTEARAGKAELETLAKGCDLLVIPSAPSTLDAIALLQTLAAIEKIAADRYRVLLTRYRRRSRMPRN